jgi:hypothetical protein
LSFQQPLLPWVHSFLKFSRVSNDSTLPHSRERLAIKGKFSVTLSIGCHMKKRIEFPHSARSMLWIKIAEKILFCNTAHVLKFTSEFLAMYSA